ncbi:MAG: very short patch repair endonuclease [Phycisphaeraceae bacterium]|nr:MAG: very short patch repair endonuclease [Phycisphaeraceae bacterium]
MRRVRSRDTSCEFLLRSALHTRGLRYSLRRKLPGSPDIVFSRARVAVFVDGCFWHGCPQHCRRPSSNTKYWHAKIDRNMARDARVNGELEALEWRVVRLWEHEVRRSPARCAARIERMVRMRIRSLDAARG